MIIQIIPANGWYAVYREDDGSETYEPVVCWALCETTVEGVGSIRHVVGLGYESQGMDEAIDFLDYRYDPNLHDRIVSASAINSELFE